MANRVRAAYRRRAPGEPRALGYLYIAPALVVFVAMVIVPLGQSVWYSLFSWDGLSVATWVGVGNYTALVSDPTLRGPFLHALVLLIFYSLLPILLGLLLAAAMSRVRVRGLTFFRTVLFLPQVLAMVVVAVTWRWIYAPGGLLNEALRLVGLDGLTHSWLGDFTLALPAIGVAGTWVGFGLCMVLFLAGVQTIPRERYEAARLDGAGPLQEFRAVTLPALRPQIAVAATLTIVAGLRNFDLIYLTTAGGPGNSTAVPAYEVYHRAFEIGQVGSAAAVGIGLTVLIFLLTVVVSRLVEGTQ
ncbi:MAG TPA: sugar ABC transporter permease [Nocardioidaceae bacterium]|jgi:raffinose/stachyose/melibiose transport system permease protein|nr:sugar ABC transporter permease [Nocardioidaceae bacterium]